MFKKLLLTSAVLFATTNVAMADVFPYVGGSLGIATNTASNAGNGYAGNYRGVPLNVFVGFGGVISQSFYLAGEITGTLLNGEISNKNDLKSSYGYGLSAIPGFMLSEHTLAFGRVGFIRTEFSNANGVATGAQVGLGLQTNVTQNVDVRFEYDYTAYNSVHRLKTPTQDAFNLGLIYKFD